MSFRLREFKPEKRIDASAVFRDVYLHDDPWQGGLIVCQKPELDGPHVKIQDLYTAFWQTIQGVIKINPKAFETIGDLPPIPHPQVTIDQARSVDVVVHLLMNGHHYSVTETMKRFLDLQNFRNYEVHEFSETGLISSTALRDFGRGLLEAS